MRFLQIMLCLASLLFCACSSTVSTSAPDVQEIKPGERSVITPPQRQQESSAANVGERPL